MKTRKILALLLSAIMLVTVLAACTPKEEAPAPASPPASNSPSAPSTSSPSTPNPPASPEPPATPMNFNSKTPRDTLVVGTPAMNGDFIEGFGNSSYDLYIKTMTGGYYQIYFQTAEGQIELNNTVAKDIKTSFDAAGNKTYTITIYDDLKWNDGSKITAKDYVAFALLYTSPQFAEAGGSFDWGEGILGYNEYCGHWEEIDDDDVWFEPTSDVFAGVQLIGEYQFSLTIAADKLPYFWETYYAAAFPIPMDVWLPGNSIVSGADGSHFANDISEACENIASTERYAPTVSCGPYIFVDFDGSVVTLKKNPYFKSDPYGNKPSFEYIVQMEVSDITDIDMVLSGDIDLLTGVIEGDKIEKARASEFAVAYSYLRAGYGYIGFPCDWGVTADVNVRWAISCIIDRNAVIDHVLNGYGGTVDAAFGMAQWTYQQKRRELAQQLTPIAFNLDKGNDFLDKSDYRFESDGKTPFDRTKANANGTYMRYNSAGEMLVIHHLSASSAVGGVIESETLKNSPLVGMKYEVTHGDFNSLLDNYYYGYQMGADRYYNAFNLASNFTAVDDKYWSWNSDLCGTWMNAEQLSDPEIDRLTLEMRRLDPSETDKFADLWVQFQVRWQQLLPNLPLYSNEYFDIFNNVVVEVPTSPYANYCDVICEITKHQ